MAARLKLAVILHADVVDSTTLVQVDEQAAHDRIRDAFARLSRTVAGYAGTVHELRGDALVAEFARASDAVCASLSFNAANAQINHGLADVVRPDLRIGIALGEVVIADGTLTGAGVVLAQRLEQLAGAGGTSISAAIREALPARLPVEYADLGERELKGFDRLHRCYTVELRSGAEIPLPEPDVEPAPAKATDGESVRRGPLVAVAPFEAQTADPRTAAIAEGIYDDLLTALHKVDAVTLLTHVETARSLNGDGDYAASLLERDVEYLVEGRVRAAGGRVRVNTQVSDLANGRYLWAERFDGPDEDDFELQDKVLREIVAALEVHLSDGEQVLAWRKEAGSNEAYEQFLTARAAYKEYSKSANLRARRGFEAAVALSPHFTAAIVGLARTHVEDARFGWSLHPQNSNGEAHRLLASVLASQPEHAHALAEYAHLYLVEGQFQLAREAASRGVRADPTLADGHHVLANVFVCVGELEDGIHHAREALRLNPSAPDFYLLTMSEALVAAGRFDEAVAVLTRVLQGRPGWLMAHALLVIAYASLEQHAAAREIVVKMRRMNPRFTVSRWRRSTLYPERPDMPRLVRLLSAAGLPD